VLQESQVESLPDSPAVDFRCRVVANGITNVVTSTGTSGHVQLVEGGRFFQRRWHRIQAGEFGADPNWSGLEVAAWPDRISFVLRLVPTNSLEDGRLEMTLDLPAAYSNLLGSGAGSALADARGAGFAVLKSVGSSVLDVDAAHSRVTVSTAVGAWAANLERSVGFLLYPAGADVSGVLTRAVAVETTPLPVRAVSTVPPGTPLAVTYDADQGWHRVQLSAPPAAGADAILRTRLDITNHTAESRVIRFNFDGTPFYIPGISAVLRDTNLYPVGIPVQLSKNWHGTAGAGRFEGFWFHGLTMLTIPAQTVLSCDLAMVGQNWGGCRRPPTPNCLSSVIAPMETSNGMKRLWAITGRRSAMTPITA
jgi:hypothetical protein